MSCQRTRDTNGSASHHTDQHNTGTRNKILLPSATHLEEGRGTTILELLRLENCISRLCPSPLGSHPPPHTQIG